MSGPSSSGIRPPHQPKGTPLIFLYDISFEHANHEIFLKAPLASICTKLEGIARRKRQFFGHNFPKTA